MASVPTTADLAKRVAELEARLGPAVDLTAVRDTAPDTPMRDAYEVRSALTDAVFGRHDRETDAQAEVDRLNDECRRDGVRHLGKPMRYDVTHVRVADEDATEDA